MEGFDITGRSCQLDKFGNVEQKCPACGMWCKMVETKKTYGEDNHTQFFWSCRAPDAKNPNRRGCGFWLWSHEPENLQDAIEKVSQRPAKRQRTDEVAPIAGPPLPSEFQKEWTELRGKVEANNNLLETILDYVMQLAQ